MCVYAWYSKYHGIYTRAGDQNGCETAGMEMIFLIDWRRSGGFRRISLCAATYLLLAIRAYRDFAPPLPMQQPLARARYIKKAALSAQ